MLVLLPFVWGWGKPLLQQNKLRVWLVMMLAAYLGHWATVWTGDATPVLPWLLIDIAAAFAVLTSPKTLAQSIIGALFAFMVCWHVGFVLAVYADAPTYTWAQGVVGWFQLLVLLGWSASDAGKALGFHNRAIGTASPDNSNSGAE